MKKFLSVILSVTLLMSCMFISVGAENSVAISRELYCGFEDYQALLTGNTSTDTFDNMSFNSSVAQITTEDAFVGEKSMKLTLASKGLTAFELRNNAPFELSAEEYVVTFAYKTNSNIEISFGMAKAGNVPATAYGITSFSADADDKWQTGAISFVADKSFVDDYVPAVIVFAKDGGEVYFDDITLTSKNGIPYVNMPAIDFDAAWYPTLKKPDKTATDEEIKVWDGTVAESFAGGSGTEADPYIIETAEQLALAITQSGTTTVTNAETGESETVNETYFGSYYKITKDIYLNSPNAIDWKNATGGSYSSLRNWYRWNDGAGENFAGSIDGSGHTVHGLYRYNGSTINYRNHKVGAGLIPNTVSGTTVKVSNLSIDNSYIRQRYFAGVLVGKNSGTVIIDNCKIGENVAVWGCTAGALVACGNAQTVTVTNSASFATYGGQGASDYQYGLIGDAIQCKLTVKNSYNANGPITSTTSTNYNTVLNIYNSYQTIAGGTGGSQSDITTLTTISAENMQGTDVFANENKMPNLALNTDGSDNNAYIATNGYPELKVFVKEVDPETGKQIEIWDGTVATEFAKGSGTEVDPYIIANGAELALAITSGGGNDQYFELSGDIYLNDINKINWYTGVVNKAYKADGLNTWYGGASTNFAGNFNGNGYTVYGIYRNEANALKGFNTNYKYGAGLFCSVAEGNTLNVTNLNVDCCYVYAECNASVLVGYALNGATLNFDKVSVGENIFIKGGQTGTFHAYAMKNNTVNININNSYSLAELDCGFIGYPARTNTTIENSFSVNGTLASGAVNNTVTLENCYQSVAGNYTEGITTLDKSNMKGTDVLTNESKMPLLGSAFEAKDRSYDEAEYLVFLPKGSIIKNSEIKAIYDNMCSPITEESAIVDNTLIKDAYILFADMSKTGEILVPAEQASFVRQGNRSDILKAGYYYDALSDRISKKVDTFGDKTVNYIFITDLHYEGADTQDSSVQERAAMLKEVQFIVDWANKDDSIDFVVLGGDLIDGNNTKAKSLENLKEIITPFRSCTKPVLAVLGNHDDNTYSGTFSIDRVISDKDWNDNVIDYVVNKDGDVAVQDSKDPNSKHYYYDLESKKTRIICLDSCDYYNEYDENGNVTYLDIRDASLGENKHDRYYTCANYRGYSKSQLKWLVDEALTADEGWDYVFISHQGIDDNTNSKYHISNGAALRGIIAAFQNNTSYENEEVGINVDYTDNTSKILSFQFGHTHTELTLFEDGLNLWQINTESANYDEVGANRAPGRPNAWNPNLNWVGNRHEASTESEANFDVMSVCREFVYKQSVGIGITEKLYYPETTMSGDMNGDGRVDILDLVEQNLVLVGEKNIRTTADTNKDSSLEISQDSAALRQLIVK